MTRLAKALSLPRRTKFSVPFTSRFELPERKICGVYFLFVRRSLIYIGASVDIAKRLTTHGSSEFTHYRYVIVRNKNLLLKLERRYLVKHRPPRNSVSLYATRATSPHERIPFYACLPRKTIAEINRRVTAKRVQWQVIVAAINITKK